MAADVRKDENDCVDCFSVISDSDEMHIISNTSFDSEYENGELPSHAIVYQQMRDVLHLQKAVAEQHLRSNVEALNTTQQSLNSTVECQRKTISNLEHKLQTEYVRKQDFIEMQEKWKEERSKHKETLAHLTTALSKLDASNAHAAALALQMEQERSALQKCCTSLSEDVQKLKEQKRELNSVVIEKTKLNEELRNRSKVQKNDFDRLKNKHVEQKVQFKQHISESEVEKQQEAYLRQMENDKEDKKARRQNSNTRRGNVCASVSDENSQ